MFSGIAIQPKSVVQFVHAYQYVRLVPGDFRPLHRRTLPASLRQGSAAVTNHSECGPDTTAFSKSLFSSSVWGYRSLNLVAVFFDLNHVQNGKQIILKNYRIINNEEECFIPTVYMFQ